MGPTTEARQPEELDTKRKCALPSVADLQRGPARMLLSNKTSCNDVDVFCAIQNGRQYPLEMWLVQLGNHIFHFI